MVQKLFHRSSRSIEILIQLLCLLEFREYTCTYTKVKIFEIHYVKNDASLFTTFTQERISIYFRNYVKID